MRKPLGVVIGRILRFGAGVLRSCRSPGVVVIRVRGVFCHDVIRGIVRHDTLRVFLRFRLIEIFFRLVDAAGGVIGNAHCSTHTT